MPRGFPNITIVGFMAKSDGTLVTIRVSTPKHEKILRLSSKINGYVRLIFIIMLYYFIKSIN